MLSYEEAYTFIFDNLKKIAFPEEWLALDKEMSKQDLFTLMVIDKHGEVTMSQISDQMNFPLSTTTGIVDRLVKKDYVVRGKSETDRRIVTICLTEKGASFTGFLKDQISGTIKRAFEILSEEERSSLLAIGVKLMTVFQKVPFNSASEKQEPQVKKIDIE